MMYRPAKAYIHLPALRHNLQVVKSLAPHSKILAVLKANGYGHGVTRVAHQFSAADGFGVASIDEAIVLRQKGFLHRILLLEGLFSSAEIPLVHQHRLDLVVHAWHQVEWLLDAPGQSSLNVWIKIDTGMHRLGFDPQDLPQVIERLQSTGKAFQLHVMSHFASADESAVFTHKQLSCFNNATQSYDFPKSISNSAGLQNYPASHYDWVRPGIMLYGAGGCETCEPVLQPVMKLVSEITALKWVKQGEYVGYGNTWQAERDTFVGIVAIGYGDGYPRHAPTGTPVLIRGQRMPLIGRVSMDMICVDLTDYADEVQIGDEAILWGVPALSVDEVARYAGTIGYELLCGVTQRVPMIEVQ
ncbi:MAG: alanine racemase [Gammaproteobacteria bacterium]|nr:alanine racemase [Gammaproteobacteria bacterium]MBD3775624.1 alanine racemase [Thiotrichales bacterium]